MIVSVASSMIIIFGFFILFILSMIFLASILVAPCLEPPVQIEHNIVVKSSFSVGKNLGEENL